MSMKGLFFFYMEGIGEDSTGTISLWKSESN